MTKAQRKKRTAVSCLEKSLRQSGKVAYLYANNSDKEFKSLIEEKIQHVWNYIYKIDDVVSDEEFLKRELKEKLDKKKSLTSIDECDEIIFYNKSRENLINIEKIRKVLFHFNIKVNVEDIIKMFLYYTDNTYFKKIMTNNVYAQNIIDTKKEQQKFDSINIQNLYIDYDTFKFIFLNLDFSIERGGMIW